jgi:hypothetical protein
MFSNLPRVLKEVNFKDHETEQSNLKKASFLSVTFGVMKIEGFS